MGRSRAARSAVRTILVAFAVVAACLGVGVAASGDSDKGDKDHSLQGDELNRLIAKEQAREDKRKRERETPEAKADRRRSRTAYKDQKSHEAHELARAKFDEVFDDRLWNGWKLGEGDRVLRTVGDSAFVVDKPSGPNLLVKSFEPLIAKDASGREERIDTSLRDDGAALTPSHTPAGARIGEQAHEGVRLPRSGIGIRLQGADPESKARIDKDKAFFANVRPDADLALAAYPRGVEALIQIRSEDGPEESVLEFDLPAGAKLEKRDGVWPMAGVEITRDGKQLGTVSAPMTQDADGETVPTSFDVRGNELIIRVDHRSGDFRYPLLVDPYAQETFYWQSGTYGMRNWWFWETQLEFQPYCNMDFACPQTQPPVPFGGAGVWARAPNRDNWAFGAKGAWVWKAPEDVSIAVFNVFGWGHKASNSWAFAWISAADDPFNYDPNSPNPGKNSGSNALMLDGTNTETSNGEHVLCTGPNPCAPAASWKNSAVFGITMLTNSNMGLQDGWASLQRPRLELWENQRPQITGRSPAAPTAWVHSTPGDFKINVTDRGLGTWRAAVRRADGWEQIKTDNCDGTTLGASCTDTQFPTDGSSFSYGTLGEGTTEFGAYAQDFVGNPSTGPCNTTCTPTYEHPNLWNIRIDRSAPSATNPSGVLAPGGAPRGWVKEGSHVLELRPTDTYSGIKQSEIEVKPGPIAWDAFARSVSGGWGNAPQGGAWSLSGTASAFNVNGDRGTMNSPQNQARMAFLGSTNSQNVDVKADVAFPNTPPVGGVEHGQLLVRRTSDATHSRIGIERGTDNKLWVTGSNGAGVALFPRTDTGLTFVNDHVYSVRARVNGTSVKVRVWDRAAEEPTTWNIDATDSAIGPQGSGAVGLRAVSTAPAGATIGFDNLVAVDLSNFKSVSTKVESCDANGCATTQPVHSHTWGTAGYPDGTWQFRGIARDPLAYGTDNPGSHVKTDTDWSVKLDRSRPVIESANLVGDRWVRPGGTHSVDVDTKDDLSGVDWIRLYVNGDPTPVHSVRGDCPGEVCTLNPAAKRLTWNVPANYTASTATLRIVAEDVATNKSLETTRTVYIDDDKPSATVSGALRNARNKAVKGNSFAVTVNGSDGDGSNPSSGIDKMQGFAGPSIGNLTERFNGTATGCPPDNCAYTFNSSFSPTAADETRTPRRIHVRVSDRVGLGSDDPPAYPSRVSQWRLNETSATNPARDSIGSYHGTYVNSPAVNQPGATTDGDRSVRFNGSNTRVDLPNVLSAAGSFTIEAWVKLDAAGQDPAIVSQRDGTGTGRSLLFVASSTGRFSSNLGGITRDSGVTAELGRWYHVAFTYAGGANAPWAFYVNGARTATGTATGESANGNWVIGANKVSACNWNGQIDDVSVYSTALGAAEVGRLAGTDPTDWRRAHWRLGEIPLVDPFDTLDAWTFDLGAGTLDAQGGQLVATDSTEKVLRADGNYTDVQGTLAFRSGSTSPSSAIGLILRRRDANNWVHGYVNPTGALSFWKKDNGVWSALTTQARPALAANTNYWIRAEARGNVLTAWLYTADPAGGATPVTTVTHTLTGADATKFGAGVSAPAGFRIQGAPIDYRYDSVRLDPLTATAARGSDVGTYTGNVTLNQAGAPNTGGQAALFDGTNGYVDVPDSAELDFGDSFSIETWFKLRAATPSGDQMIAWKGINGYLLYITGGKLTLRKGGVGNIVQATTNSGIDNQWHHVVATKSGSSAKIFLDGVDVSGAVTNQTIQDTTAPFRIGGDNSGTWFNGWLDEVALYPGALTAGEVSQLYAQSAYDWRVVFDNGAPTLDPPAHAQSHSNWVNSLDTLKTTLTAHDSVTGIKRFKLFTPRIGGGEDVQTHTFDDCSDGVDHLCAVDRRRTFTYNVGLMPDGATQRVRAVAEDAVTNQSTERNWDLRVDNTKPAAPQKAGELAEQGKWVRPGVTYSLTADTSDNLSGVERIDFKVNGTVVQSQPGDNCNSNGCDLNPPAKPFSWTVPNPYSGAPSPALELVAVDAAGNESVATAWTVRVDNAVPPMPALTGSLWDVRGTATNGSNFGLDVVATDTVEGAGGSGVKQIKLLVAPETRAAAEGPPDERGASPPQSTPANTPQSHHFDFSPLASDESRTARNVIVQVEDQAGHKAQYPWKVIFDREVPSVATPVDNDHSGSWWYNELESPTLTVSATDSISGLGFIGMSIPQSSGDPYVPYHNFGCGNTIPAACGTGQSRPFTFAASTMPEGEVQVTGAAQDAAGNQGFNGQKTVKVDRSKPQLQSKSGPLSQPGAWVKEGQHNLTLNWNDPFSGVLTSSVEFQRPAGMSDSFERTSSSGWGQADTGGAWSVVAGSAGDFTVGDGRGTISATSTAIRTAVLASSPTELFDASVRVRMPDELPTNNSQVYGGIMFRSPTDNRFVRAAVRIEPSGLLRIHLSSETFSSMAAINFNWSPGAEVNVRLRKTTAPGIVATAWRPGDPEPTSAAQPGYVFGSDIYLFPGQGQLGLTATNVGTGSRSISFDDFQVREVSSSGGQQANATNNCGRPGCPTTLTHSYTWNSAGEPEGIHTIRPTAFDAVTHPSDVPTWTFGLDRTGPRITETSGSLHNVNQATRLSQLNLHVETEDGAPAVPASGVKQIRLLVGPDVDHLTERGTSPIRENPDDNEPMEHDFTFFTQESDEGREGRIVRVEARDEAENVSHTDWRIVFDRGNPVIQSVTHDNPTTKWFRPDESQTSHIDAMDAISGVQTLRVSTPREDGGADYVTDTLPCINMLPDLCPVDPPARPLTYGAANAPDGRNTAYAVAVDPAFNESDPYEWDFRVDGEEPDVELSGLLKTHENLLLVAGSYDLQIDAIDGDRSTPAAERSGVKEIEVFVKPEAAEDSAYKRAYHDDQECAEGSCEMHRNWIFRTEGWDEGEYRVKVDVTDQVGNKASPSFKFRVGPAVFEPRHAQGLEDFWQFHSVDTGGGTRAHVNVGTGNMVWHSTPVVNPGRGLSSVVNLTYNSQAQVRDVGLDYNQVGEGFSIGASSITRINEPLDLSLTAVNGPIFMTDPDGTRHRFRASGQGDWYIPPAGVNLHLRRYSASLGPEGIGLVEPDKAWAATRPDGITYFFDAAGYPTTIEDRNGNPADPVGDPPNKIRYDYEYLSLLEADEPCEIVAPLDNTALASELCRRRLIRVVDAAGVDADPNALDDDELPDELEAVRDSRSLHICYEKDILEETTEIPGVTHIPGNGPISRIKDHAGRVLQFEYNDPHGERYLSAIVQTQHFTPEDASGEDVDPDCRRDATLPDGTAEAERIFRFNYEPKREADEIPNDPVGTLASLAARRYLTSVVDPAHASDPQRKTTFNYQDRDIEQGVTAFERRRILSVQDRRQSTTSFTYAEVEDGGETFRQAAVKNARGNDTVHRVDDRARPRQVIDAAQSKTTLKWDDDTTQDNNVVELTRGIGPDGDMSQAATTTMEYDLNGMLKRQQDPIGNVATLEYRTWDGFHVAPSGADANQGFVSDLLTTTTPRGNAGTEDGTWGFEYDLVEDGLDIDERRGNPRRQRDPEGFVAQTDFDALGQVIREVDFEDPDDPNDDQNVTTYGQYDANGLAREKIDPRGNANGGASAADHRWLYCYDAAGNLRRATDPRGATPGDPCTVREAFTRSYTYDAMDRVLTEKAPRNSEAGDFTERAFTYDVNDNLTSERDGNGKVTLRRYSKMDELLEVETPEVPHWEDAGAKEPEITRYDRDEVGNVTRVTRPMGMRPESSSQFDYSTEYTYDVVDRVVQKSQRQHKPASTGPGGEPIAEVNDSLITSYAYDRRGNTIGLTDPKKNSDDTNFLENPKSDPTRRFRYDFDKADQRKAVVENPGPGQLETRYEYDENGNVKSITDPRAFDARDDDDNGSENDDDDKFRTKFEHDGRDLLVERTSPGNRTMEWVLRGDGKPLIEKRPRGIATEDVDGDFEVKFDYYATGELKSRTLPKAENQYGLRAGAIVWHRNAVGDPTTITDARAAEVIDPEVEPERRDPTYSFDNRFYDTGDLMETDRPGWWRYTEGGKRQEDARPIQERNPDQMGKESGDDGNPGAGSGDENEKGAADRRDAKPASPGDFGSGSKAGPPGMLPRAGLTKFSYDEEMRLEQVEDAAGQVTTIDRDALGRVGHLTAPFKPGNSIRMSYEYDHDGQIVRSVDGRGNDTLSEYDQFGRRILEVAPGSAPNTTDEDTPAVTTYRYDRNSNVLRKVTPRGTEGGNPDEGFPNDHFRHDYTYDAFDRMLTHTNPRGPEAAAEVTTYEYDSARNKVLERSPRGQETGLTDGDCDLDDADTERACFETRSWFNGNNELFKMTDGHGQTTQLEYDEHGNQTEVRAPGSKSSPTDDDADPELTVKRFDGRDLPWITTTGTGEAERTSVTEYDANGNLRRTVNPAGIGSDDLPIHSDTGPQITNPTTAAHQSNSALKSATFNAEITEHNADDIVTAVLKPWGGDDSTPGDEAANNRKRYRENFWLDSLGRATRVDSAYEWTSSHPCDQQPAASADDDDCEGRTRHDYFLNGWLESSLDPTLKDNAEVLDSGRKMVYDYDKTGNQILWRSEKPGNRQREITRTYHENGLVQTRRADPADSQGGTLRTYFYAYDANGGLKRIEDDELDRVTTIARDGMGRELTVDEEHTGADDRHWENDTWTDYDLDGNPEVRRTDGDLTDSTPDEATDYSGGKLTRFEFDALDRETRTEVQRFQSNGDLKSTRYYETEYYASGKKSERVKRSRQPGMAEPELGTTEQWFFDDAGRIVRRKRHGRDNANPKDHTYEYDANTNRKKDERGTYEFNARDQIVRWKKKGEEGDEHLVQYRVTGTGAVEWTKERLNGQNVETTFTFEGDRLTKAKTTNAPEVNYCYTEFGSLAAIQDEACGTTPNDSNDSIYKHDELDRVVVTRQPGKETSRYVYDGLDRRDQKCKHKGALEDTLPTLSSIGECTAGSRSDMSYIGTSDKLSQERGTETLPTDSKTRTYDYDSEGERLGYERTKPGDPTATDLYRTYEKDANGSVVGLEQNDGAIADNEQYAYDPYGELRKPDLSAPMTERYQYEESETLGFSEEARDNPFRFEGHYYDSGVKLYDMGARSYRPDVGRFLSQDRYEAASDDFNVQTDPLTQSRYAFAGGNPINNVEWDGHHTVTCLSADHCSYAYEHWRKHHPKPKPPKPKRKKKQEVVIVATSDQRVVAVVQSNGRVNGEPALVSMETLRQHGTNAQFVTLRPPPGQKKAEEKKDDGGFFGGVWKGFKETVEGGVKLGMMANPANPYGWYLKAKVVVGTVQYGKALAADPGGTLSATGDAFIQRYSGGEGKGLLFFDLTLTAATLGTGGLAKGGMTGAKAASSVPTVTFSRARAPNIAANFDNAVAGGAPTRLTKIEDLAQQRRNRREALRGHEPAPAGQSLDEYPFACSAQGGAGSCVAPVPQAEQSYQGGVLSQFFQRHGIGEGDPFNVEFGQ